MSTPHVAGLVALLWQAAPSLTISDRHEDYSGDDESWWENPNTRIHEIEWILEATATYLPPSPDTGVPKEDNSTGMDGRPMDYCQGYGNINVEKAVAVALTLERLRKMHRDKDITVADALRSYEDMMVVVNESAKTDVLSVQWEGEYSKYNDQLGRTIFEVNLTKYVFVPQGVQRVIIDLAYDPLDASEMIVGDLTYTIDFDNDGNVDVTGGLEPVLSGNRHEEIDVGDSNTDSLWAFGIVGEGVKLQNPIRENSYVELRMEYTMSVQLVLGPLGEEVLFVDYGEDNSMIAPLRFGDPSPGYEGMEIGMNVNYFDLEAVELKEPPKIKPKDEEGVPWALVVVLLLVMGLVIFYFLRRRKVV
jgi:hypothetical protein